MTDYSVHTTQLNILMRELADALRAEKWDDVLSITNSIDYHKRGIENYARRRLPNVPY